jgi:DDE superfamily endonuclease/Tc5 transposase DNA-binding domain
MAPIDLAIEYLRSLEPGEQIRIRETAKRFGVHYSTLSRRFRQITASKEEQYNSQCLLNKQQSETLIKWINQLTERGLPPTRQILCNFAEEISGKKPGKNWAQRWIKAHSDKVISRYSTGLDMDRKRADSAFKYSLYFELLGRKIEQYNLLPEQIYNMDEKGFMIGITSKSKRIFSRQQYEQGGIKQHLQDGNREWITTIGCICANGTALPPGLIYMAKSGNLQDSWLQDFNPKEHACFFAASDSGWTNNELGFQWLSGVFDKTTKGQASRGWRLLILDGHGSHINMKFIDYCDQNRILLALFPAHATHTLQPLDVGLFSPLSKAYSDELMNFLYKSQGFTRLTKRDFFRLFWASWGIAFTKKNINSAFKNTGLNPFNPDIILQRYNKKSESRPSSSRSTASALSAEDWRQIRKLLHTVVNDFHDNSVQKLNNTIIALSTENILLKTQLQGLEQAFINEKKRRIKKKPLLLELAAPSNGGAIFFSPSKVQQARDLQLQKNELAAQEIAYKSEKKLQQQLIKESREQEKLERAQIRQQKQEERRQQAAEKQHLKDEEKLAKQADLQLQKDVIATPKRSKKQPTPILKLKEPKTSSLVDEEVVEEVIPTNRRGRQIRLPVRFR